MTKKLVLDDFLQRNRIDRETWEKSSTEWTLLQSIATDHEAQVERLRDTAELFARLIQRFPAVHSVRWRIKDVEHLLEKIVRKRADGQEKYLSITESNYYEIVTDLVGIRALHLFKDDCFSIDEDLRNTWTPTETPIVYARAGDPLDLESRFSEKDFAVKEHRAGYRSVHYVFATQPHQRKVFTEVQVRTIFEEGWSEIDHRIRYPRFSEDKLVAYFLAIFNRLAGSADEMGTFVQGLTNNLDAMNARLVEANRQKEDALAEMERMLADLANLKKQDEVMNRKFASLQEEMVKLRRAVSVNDQVADNSSKLASFISASANNVISGILSGSPLTGLLSQGASLSSLSDASRMSIVFPTSLGNSAPVPISSIAAPPSSFVPPTNVTTDQKRGRPSKKKSK